MISNFQISSKEGKLAGWDWINWGIKMSTVKTFLFNRQEAILSMTDEEGYFLQLDTNVTTEAKV